MASAGAHRFARRAAFWGAVAVVSILANFGLELVADKNAGGGPGAAGLARFTAFTHRGVS